MTTETEDERRLRMHGYHTVEHERLETMVIDYIYEAEKIPQAFPEDMDTQGLRQFLKCEDMREKMRNLMDEVFRELSELRKAR